MTLVLGRPLHVLETVDSTNTHLKRLAAEGAPAGTVVRARMQTAGYGQRGRSWVSAPDRGLYVSCLLPLPKGRVPTQLPFVAGLGCRDALLPYAPELGLKWVNDLVVEGRKLGGLLVETTNGMAVVGIGVNLQPQDAPEATCLADYAPMAPGPEALLDELLDALAARYRQWEAEGFEAVRADWCAASVTLGRAVQVLGEAAPRFGRASGLGPNGELLLTGEDGATEAIVSGTVRTADGRYC